ncbi:uncharacterized protein METZ01_LOCUS434909 [marine metagenome]|uniref:Uncharacterized protein n=1 Tax=marine metagenome TaxID=408172 RepID=A0A382YGT5_9ZZZZ
MILYNVSIPQMYFIVYLTTIPENHYHMTVSFFTDAIDLLLIE